jgi:hypothetical protein
MNEEEIRLIDDNAFIPYIITCAKSGCKQSAMTLMQFAAEYLSTGGTIPDNLRRYLSEAFNHILQGESADKALYLRHGRGKNDTALYRKQAVAHEVRRLYWVGEAKTIEEACKMVSKHGAPKPGHISDRIFVDEKTAYKYYYGINLGTPERRPVM